MDVITFSTHRLHFLYTHHHIFNYHSHAMISLHWLCVPERIVFKVATLTLRALHGTAPPYTTSQFTRVADMSNRRKLRSASSNQVDVPSFCLPTVGSRAFRLLVLRSGTAYQMMSPPLCPCQPSEDILIPLLLQH